MEIRDTAIARTIEFEGLIAHFYLDTKAKPTIGVGYHIPDEASAAKLKLSVDGSAATEEQKKEAWRIIVKQVAGKPAHTYAKFTKPRMSEKDAKSYLKARLESDAAALLKKFPDLDKYPEEAQDALLDMIYNIGMTAFSEANWPKLFKAVKAKDWKTAAIESNRKDVQDSRNKQIAELFNAAAETRARRSGEIEVLGKLDDMLIRQIEEIKALGGEGRPGLFPGGITRISLKAEAAGVSLELEVEGPERSAGL
jgi:GH24 family phage-related lysozyme (muramidase)